MSSSVSAVASGLRSHALRLLAARPHSSAELQRRLVSVCERRKSGKRLAAEYAGVPCVAVCERVLVQLREDKLVEDQSYAVWHVGQRTRHRPRSSAALFGELSAKGVAREHVSSAMSNFPEYEQCSRLVAKRGASMPRERLLMYLQRRGFPYAIASRAMAAAAAASLLGPRAPAADGDAIRAAAGSRDDRDASAHHS